jgi:tocopherol cyclase
MDISDLKHRWQALWHPERFHGWGRQKAYFEGWYFKLIHPQEKAALAVIPGISMDAHGKKEVFIQVLDGMNAKANYHTFPVDAFTPSPDRFHIHIGSNSFSNEEMILDLPELKGQLSFSNTNPWPKTLGAPGIMGWYAFMPFMECYHGVWSMHHHLAGKLTWKGEELDFTNGLGYGEKDWGSSFPRGWIWTQCNHFDSSGEVSVMASTAHIPWLGTSFVGFIGGILFEGKLYRFATYTGSKRQARIEGEHIYIAFQDRQYTLEISAKPGAGAHLQSPLQGAMTGKVNESLQAKMDVRFLKGNEVLFAGQGKWCGLEVAGEVDSLLSNEWTK